MFLKSILNESVLDSSFENVCQLVYGHILKREGDTFKVEKTGYPYPDCITTNITEYLFNKDFLERLVRGNSDNYISVNNILIDNRHILFKLLISDASTRSGITLEELVSSYLSSSNIVVEYNEDTNKIKVSLSKFLYS